MPGTEHFLPPWDEADGSGAPVALKLCRACEVVCVADLERCWNCGALLVGEQALPATQGQRGASHSTTAMPAAADSQLPPWLLESSVSWQGPGDGVDRLVATPGSDPQAVSRPGAAGAPATSRSLPDAPRAVAAFAGQTSEHWNAGVITSLAVVLGTVAVVGIDQFSLGVSDGFTRHPGRESVSADVAEAPRTPEPRALLPDAIPSEPDAASARAPQDAPRPVVAETAPSRLDAGRIAAESPIRTADFVVDRGSEVPTPRSGKAIYQQSCASCHDAGKMNSPSVHDMASWTERLARGKHSLYASVTAVGGGVKHPAQTRALTDDELVAATDYLTERLIDLSVARASRAGYSIRYGPGGETLREASLKSD